MCRVSGWVKPHERNRSGFGVASKFLGKELFFVGIDMIVVVEN